MNIEISKEIEILVFTGPESSGKTTCAQRIAQQYQLPLVEEYARAYLNEHGAKYSFDDIKEIASLQIDAERIANKNNSLIVCDTDIITLEIWALEKFGISLDMRDEFVNKKHYLLCYPDIPWEPDPLRENPDDRERLFGIYKDYIEEFGISFTVLNERERADMRLELPKLDSQA